MPYALTDHVHEREVTRHLGVPVEFMPHVASHFRGITMTVNLWLQHATTREAIENAYRDFYAGEPLVRIVDEAPWVSRIAGRHSRRNRRLHDRARRQARRRRRDAG